MENENEGAGIASGVAFAEEQTSEQATVQTGETARINTNISEQVRKEDASGESYGNVALQAWDAIAQRISEGDATGQASTAEDAHRQERSREGNLRSVDKDASVASSQQQDAAPVEDARGAGESASGGNALGSEEDAPADEAIRPQGERETWAREGQGGTERQEAAGETPAQFSPAGEDTSKDEIEGEDTISFADLGLDEVTLAAVAKKGFKTPSSIQVQTIPRLLSGDANVIAKARTGTGKTAAFGLPLVQQLRQASDHVRAIILEPTRELALQTAAEMASFATGRWPRTAVVYGGSSITEQMRALRGGVEIVVGTPGRVQDLIDRGVLNIERVDYFILDEGDEMLDMGFIEDIENIFECAAPDCRVLLFSATVPKEIVGIAEEFMGEYEIIEEEGYVEEALPINQKYWLVREGEKIEALVRLIDISPDFYGLVFVQRKADADVVAKALDERGYQVAALHGDIAQAQREKILDRFKAKKTHVLVATDVAARGIDIEGLTHVVNYELPFDGATYIHRIGRTGRAGSAGAAVTFVRPEEARRKLRYLINAVRKSAKGEIVEEAVPSVEEVIEAKKGRLFGDIRRKLGLTDEGEGEGNGLRKTNPIFDKLAQELCEGRDAQDVVASLLSLSYGKEVSKNRYGRVSTFAQERAGAQGRGNWRDRGDRREGGESYAREGQLRIYAKMGWEDGYNPRKIADFFHDLLGVPSRKVDAIDMADRFCLLSLPADDARRALVMSERDKSLPHMHLDTKVQGTAPRAPFDRGYARSSRSEGWGERRRERGFRGRGEALSRHERMARGKSSSQVHTPTQRNTSSSFFRRSDKFQEY